MDINSLKAGLSRLWTVAPSKAASELPRVFHKSPRLDPVRYIARRAAAAKYGLYSKRAIRASEDEAQKIIEHELYGLLDAPCPNFPEIDGYQLRYLTVAHIRLVGEFFWLKVRDGTKRGRIIALLPIPAAWVLNKPTVGNHFFTIYPYGVTAGSAVKVPASDVVWFKNPDLLDPYANGRGETEAILDEIEIDENASKFQKNSLYNGVSSPFAIIAEGATEPQVKQIKAGFINSVAGFLTAKLPTVLTTRGARIEKLGDTMKELDMLETRKFLRDEVLQHSQIPPELFGILENSNRSTIDAADYLFSKNVLTDELQFFERVVTSRVCSEYDDDLCLVHDNVIQEDDEFDLKVYQAGVDSGIVTENEFRTRFGLKVKPDGDVRLQGYTITRVPVGTKPVSDEPSVDGATSSVQSVQATALNGAQLASLMEVVNGVTSGSINRDTASSLLVIAFPTLSKTEIDNLINSALPGESVLDIDDDTLDVEESDNTETPPAPQASKSIGDDTETERRKCAVWKSFDAKSISTEDAFRRASKTIAEAQEVRIVNAIKSAPPKSSSDLDAIIGAVFNEDTDKAVKQTFAPAWIASLNAGREQASETLGKSYPSGTRKAAESVYNEYFNYWIETNGLEKAKEINGTTIEALKSALVPVIGESISSGDSLGDMIEKLTAAARDAFIPLTTTRAENIARTESASTVNAGTYTTYSAEGVQKKEWLSVRDGRTREAHSSVDGQIVDIDKPFIVDGESLMYPGDPTLASAGNICRCRCTIAAVFEY